MPDLAIFSASQAIFFGIGCLFFRRLLMRDYEVRSEAVQSLFGATFAVSCGMFELIIFEIASVLTKTSRLQFWNWLLVAMCLLLVVVVPLSLAVVTIPVLRCGCSTRGRITAAAGIWIVYLYLLWAQRMIGSEEVIS